MDQLPPAPDRPDRPSAERDVSGFQMPTSAPPPQRRPGPVTAAGWALIVIGGLITLSGLFVSSLGIDASAVVVATVIALAIGGGNLLAGVLVLRSRPVGRTLGFVFAGLGILGGLAQLSNSPGSALITLAVDGFILWALATNREAFRSPG